jgi:hypothetical protein
MLTCETGGVNHRRSFACVLALTLSLPWLLCAQQPAPNGVAAAWDVTAQMKAFSASVRQVEPLLRHVNPAEWVEKGAPDAYVRQLQSARQAITALAEASDSLALKPESTPLALEVYFQMERMELLLSSLREGIRKYQSSELDGLIAQDTAGNVVHRERLRQHIRDLADLREQEYQIANEEAQRCRGILTKQPAATPKSKPSGSKK